MTLLYRRVDPLKEFLLKVGTKEQYHQSPTGTLYNHLVGTRRLLRKWECSDDVCNAGLFHSIYGTPIYDPKTLSIDDRKIVRDLIGERSEHLVHLFHISGSDDRLFEFIDMSEPDRSDLITIDYANSREQSGPDWDDVDYHPYIPSLSLVK